MNQDYFLRRLLLLVSGNTSGSTQQFQQKLTAITVFYFHDILQVTVETMMQINNLMNGQH